MSEKGWILGIAITLLVVLIAYTITMFELYRNHLPPFSRYKPPPPPTSSFYPLGGVTPLTPDEIKLRNQKLCEFYGKGPNCFS